MQLEPGAMFASGVGAIDGVFDRSVVVLLDADADGTLGVIINRVHGYEIDAALPGWSPLVCFPTTLFLGGPVSPEGAICLAVPRDPSEEPPGWRRLFGSVGLLHLDTPVEIVEGAYQQLRIFAGYAGWSPGQLEGELDAGLWHPIASRHELIFDEQPGTIWRRALRGAGGELGMLATWTPTPQLN